MSTNIYIKTYGCSLNQSDSELMAGLLKEAGFNIVKKLDDAFIVIINTCTVKGLTERKFYKYLNEVKKEYKYKKIIITGCIPQTDPSKLKKYGLLGTTQVSNIVQLVEEVIHDNPIAMLEKEQLPRLNLPKIRKNPIVEIIPICEGCLGSPCAYCKVKQARGNLRSYPIEEIVQQARRAVIKDKVKEILITAQDTGCYGKDINSSLPLLLKELIKIPGDFKIRLGEINPNHAYEFLNELIEIYNSEKMFKFIHLPVQSGNNEILKAMKRKYTVEQFREIVSKFKTAIPNITIATDIIVGFPGENEEMFQGSLDLIKDITPDVLNLSRFWNRPGTKAAEMEGKVSGAEIKKRFNFVESICTNISRMRNERWLGWKGEILVDEIGKDGTMVGRNFAYKPVIVQGDFKIGDKLIVKIRKTGNFDLRV